MEGKPRHERRRQGKGNRRLQFQPGPIRRVEGGGWRLPARRGYFVPAPRVHGRAGTAIVLHRLAPAGSQGGAPGHAPEVDGRYPRVYEAGTSGSTSLVTIAAHQRLLPTPGTRYPTLWWEVPRTPQ